jgi:hypothetical protein
MSYCKLASHQLLLINTQGPYIRNEDMRNRMDMGIIGDESNSDAVYTPFLFQSCSQVTTPLLNEAITA